MLIIFLLVQTPNLPHLSFLVIIDLCICFMGYVLCVFNFCFIEVVLLTTFLIFCLYSYKKKKKNPSKTCLLNFISSFWLHKQKRDVGSNWMWLLCDSMLKQKERHLGKYNNDNDQKAVQHSEGYVKGASQRSYCSSTKTIDTLNNLRGIL